MEIQLQEWASGKPEGGIDKTAFVLKGVKVLGLQSKHGYSYNALGLKAAVGLYEGLAIKAAGHPQPGQPMGVQYADKLGFLRNARFVDGQGIYGDVHLNPHQKLSEALMWDLPSLRTPRRRKGFLNRHPLFKPEAREWNSKTLRWTN